MKQFPSGEKGMGALAGCKVRSGKPGRFEHKKGDERGGIPAESWSKQRADGNLGRKKGPFTVRLRSGGCGERKKEEPWGTAAVLRRCGRRDGNGTPYRFWVRRQKEDVRTREGRRELLEKYRKGIEISQA